MTTTNGFDALRAHLVDDHHNEAAGGLTDQDALGQHFHEHNGPGGLRNHEHDHTIPALAPRHEQFLRQFPADDPLIPARDASVVLDRLQREIQDLEQRLTVAHATNRQLRNALKWIRLQAGLHYMGAAFEPEHMRTLANLAADALTPEWLSEKVLPDFDKVMRKARKRGERMAEEMNLLAQRVNEEEEETDGP